MKAPLPCMANKPHVELPRPLFHVIARGNRRARLFHDEVHYHPQLDHWERHHGRDRPADLKQVESAGLPNPLLASQEQ